MARYVFIFPRDPFYKPSSDPAREQRVCTFKKQVLLLPVDHHSVAVAMRSDRRIRRVVIADALDGESASVGPGNSGGLHVSGRVKRGINAYINPFPVMPVLTHVKHLPFLLMSIPFLLIKFERMFSYYCYHTTDKSIVSRMYFFPTSQGLFGPRIVKSVRL